MNYLELKNGLNNSFNSIITAPQYTVNKVLTILFCILAFFFLYACGNSALTLIPPSTTTHKVTFDVNKPDRVSATVTNPPSELTVNENATATEPATPPALTGYTFDGWYTEASTTTAFQFSTKITKATTLYAKWTRLQTFTITYHDNKPQDVTANVTGVPEPVTVSINLKTTAPTATPELQDYDFQGWFAGTATGTTLRLENTAFDFTKTAIKENKDLYAKWTRKKVTIAFYGNKPDTAPTDATITGLTPNPKTVIVNSGETTTALKPPPELTGYTLAGWFIGTISGGTLALQDIAFDFTTTAIRGDNINLYAKWTRKQLTITYLENKPSGVTESITGFPSKKEEIINSGDKLTPPPMNPDLSDYGFVGWYGGTETGGTVTLDPKTYDFTTPITANTKIYAKWSRTQVTVTYVANKSAGVTEAVVRFPSPLVQTIDRSTRLSEPTETPELSDYGFVGWYGGTETGGSVTLEDTAYDFTIPITADTKIYAKWSRTQVTVTYVANKPAGVTEAVVRFPSPLVQTIDRSTRLSEPTETPELSDYGFVGWYGGTETGGTVTLDPKTYDFTTPITANTKIYAKWSRTQVTVTFVENKPAGVAEAVVQFPSPLVHTIDRSTRLSEPTETPELSDYGFVGWYGGTDSGGVVALDTDTYDFTTPITASTKIYAKWSRTQVTVTYVTNKPVGVTEDVARFPSPLVQTIDRSTRLSEPTETPELSDYGFVGWYGGIDSGGVVALDTDTYDFTTPITASTKIYAKWSRTQVTVTYVENKPAGVTEAVVRFPSPLVQTIDRSTRLSEPTETPELSDYGFVGWYGGIETGGSVTLEDTAYDFTIPITASTKIYAKWSRTQVTVTYVENKPVGVTEAVVQFPSPLVHTIDRSTTLAPPTETPNLSDYGFVGWYGGTETGGTVALDTETYDFNTLITADTKIYAKWSRTQVMVTYVENKPVGVTEAVVQFPSPLVHTIDRSTTLAPPTETPNLSDYGFVGWYGDTETGGSVTLEDTAYDFTIPITEDTKIYAKWSRTQVTVTYVANKPAGVTEAVVRFPSPLVQTIDRSTRLSEPTETPELSDYGFVGWYGGTETGGSVTLEDTAYDFTIPITADTKIYAKWSRTQVTVTYVANKPAGVTEAVVRFPSPLVQTIDRSTRLSEPTETPDLSDYDFKGWYGGTETGGTVALDTETFNFTTPITADTKIYAKWSRTQVMVTFVENKPAGVTEAVARFPSPLVQTIDRSNTLSKPTETPELSDYGFVGWYGGTETGGTVALDTETFNFTTPITADTKIYAKWSRTQVMVTYVENKPAGVTEAVVRFPSPLVQTIDRSTRLSEPTETPELSDYGFVGWYGGTETGGTVALDTETFNFTTPITADTKIYAKWSRTQVMVTYVENKPAGVTEAVVRFPSPLVQTIDRSTRLSEPTETPELSDYGFVGWYGGIETGGSVTLEDTAYDFTIPITASTKIYAKWSRTQVTVTYVENKPAGVTEAVVRFPSPLVQTIDRSTRLSEPTETPELSDYGFVGWYGGTETGGSVTLEDTAYDFTIPITADTKIYAKWSRTQVTVTYVENKPAGVTEAVVRFPSPLVQTIDRSTTIAKPKETPGLSDYDFKGWYGGTETGGTVALDTETFNFTTPITADTKIYAKWSRTQVTVTYVANKPVGVTEAVVRMPSPLVQSIDRSTRLSEPTETPELSDYGFVGWYGGTETGGVVALDTETFNFTTPITADTKIYAKWSRTQVTVTYVENKPAGVTEAVVRFPSPLVQTIGRSTRLSEPTETPGLSDYGFVGWYGGTETGGVVALDTDTYDFTTPITADTKIYAKWSRKQVTVTYVENKPVGVTEDVARFPSPLVQTIDRSTRLSEPTETPDLSDYGFVGWYGGTVTGTTLRLENTAFVFTTTAIKENKDLYAKWERKKVTITFYGNKPDTAPTDASITGLTTDPTIVTVNSGETTAAPIPPPELTGYTLDGWFIGTISGGTLTLQDTAFDFTTTIIRGDNINLYAKWSQNPLVTFDTQGGSDIASQTITAPLTMAARPDTPPTRDGYQFVNWYTMATGGVFYDFTLTVSTSITVYAQWTRNTYTITFNHNYGATPATSIETTDQEGKVSPPDLSMARFQGYIVTGWFKTKDGSDKIDDFTTEVFNENITLYAKWVFRPKTKAELVAELNRAITPTTPSPNLNYIDTSLITDMSGLFKDKTSFNGDISGWNVSNVENMNQMFYSARAFNRNISSWNVAKVTDMQDMFAYNPVFSQELNNWNVSKVENMEGMFKEARAFNGNLSSWNVAKVTYMQSMFSSATAFNGNISSWNVAKVTNMNSMFSLATAFNGNISSWNVAKVTNMNSMFAFNPVFSQELNNWNVSKVKNMEGMFKEARAFNGNLSSWNVAMVTNMKSMFSSAIAFNGNISSWNVSLVKNMSFMFSAAFAFNQNISSWNVAKVTNMRNMFAYASVFNQNISSWNVDMVNDFGRFKTSSALSDDNTPDKFK